MISHVWPKPAFTGVFMDKKTRNDNYEIMNDNMVYPFSFYIKTPEHSKPIIVNAHLTSSDAFIYRKQVEKVANEDKKAIVQNNNRRQSTLAQQAARSLLRKYERIYQNKLIPYLLELYPGFHFLPEEPNPKPT